MLGPLSASTLVVGGINTFGALLINQAFGV
jgi:hypothetical protein